MEKTNLSLDTLDALEETALAALVKQASEGNNAAAASALIAIERVRKTRHAEMHRQKMAELASAPDGLCAYLASLGAPPAEVEARIGRRMSKAERDAYERATDDRLLEVRAVELGRMRRGEADVPRWATKR